MITIIGIGNEKGDLTLKAVNAIKSADVVFLRSAKTKAGGAISKEYSVTALDDFFNSAECFDELYCSVADKIMLAASNANVAYLSDGDGTDEIAQIIAKRASGDEIKFICGVAQNSARGINKAGVTLSATYAVNARPYIDSMLPLYVTEIDDKFIAGDLKLWLAEYYSDKTPVTFSAKGKSQPITLMEIDRQKGYGYDCELYISAQDSWFKEKYCYADLMRIMEKLTSPSGCPWDKAQTHESIRINLIEEAYEAVDAIDSGDPDSMIEELGDVMLQAIFHCDMARRFNEFEPSEVISGLCRKLVNRHTHIFGENKAKNAEEALAFWENAKSEEKSYTSTADKINRLPDNFPSLLACEKIYSKLKKAGISLSADRLKEIICDNSATPQKRMFALCALMAENGADAETDLNKYVKDIKARFARAEKEGNTKDFLETL